MPNSWRPFKDGSGPLILTGVIVVVVEVEDEEGDEAGQEAHDGHGDVVAEGALGAAATHLARVILLSN